MIQPVVKTVWQPVECLYTRYNRLLNQLSYRSHNRLDNRLYRVYKHPTGCQIGCTTGCSVVQPVGQPAASCKQTSNRLSNRLYNRVQPVWQRAVSCKRGIRVIMENFKRKWLSDVCEMNRNRRHTFKIRRSRDLIKLCNHNWKSC